MNDKDKFLQNEKASHWAQGRALYHYPESLGDDEERAACYRLLMEGYEKGKKDGATWLVAELEKMTIGRVDFINRNGFYTMLAKAKELLK